jgi:hypothetical protein
MAKATTTAKARRSPYTEGLLDRIAKAQARDRMKGMLLHMELYCDYGSCPMRTLEVYVKDFHRDLVALIEERGAPCPLCGKPLKVHWVRTPVEYDEEQEREARSSVNGQRWKRDHPEAWAMPLLMDDTLPA